MSLSNDQIVKILTHVEDAKERLIEQYKEKPKLEGVIAALVQEIQELETTFCQLLELRLDIDAASGFQLDKIGEIVGAEREGRTDPEYRIFLKVKVNINVTSGQPERLLTILDAITDVPRLELQEWPPAGIGIGIGGDIIDTDLIDFYYSILDRAIAAGVRLDWLWCFDGENAFAFDGDPGQGTAGFGDDGDPLIGGELGTLHFPSGPRFAFSGDESDLRAGFSSINDNLVGGLLDGL